MRSADCPSSQVDAAPRTHAAIRIALSILNGPHDAVPQTKTAKPSSMRIGFLAQLRRVLCNNSLFGGDTFIVADNYGAGPT